jgi:hypothetical protein
VNCVQSYQASELVLKRYLYEFVLVDPLTVALDFSVLLKSLRSKPERVILVSNIPDLEGECASARIASRHQKDHQCRGTGRRVM